jgi:hypothetical protein
MVNLSNVTLYAGLKHTVILHKPSHIKWKGSDSLIRPSLTDEVILTISGLAGHEVIKVTEEKRKPSNSPLQSARLLNIYGGMQVVPEYRNAILRRVALRVGIENLTLPGHVESMVM